MRSAVNAYLNLTPIAPGLDGSDLYWTWTCTGPYLTPILAPVLVGSYFDWSLPEPDTHPGTSTRW